MLVDASADASRKSDKKEREGDEIRRVSGVGGGGGG